jgi:hypothetical protein
VGSCQKSNIVLCIHDTATPIRTSVWIRTVFGVCRGAESQDPRYSHNYFASPNPIPPLIFAVYLQI